MKYIFFHYGPGGNANAEMQWPLFPGDVEFWNQPQVSTYKDLVSRCIEKALEHKRKNKNLNIVAHSFGCDLALEVSREVKVDHMVLLCPMVDIPMSFFNFSHKILRHPELDNSLKLKIEEELVVFNPSNIASFWNLVSLITQFPFFDLMYWRNRDAYEKYKKIVSQEAAFDFIMWQKVLNSFLESDSKSKLIFNTVDENDGCQKMDILLGKYDPYFDEKRDVLFWKENFSKANIQIVESGHFPHFETQILSNILEL